MGCTIDHLAVAPPTVHGVHQKNLQPKPRLPSTFEGFLLALGRSLIRPPSFSQRHFGQLANELGLQSAALGQGHREQLHHRPLKGLRSAAEERSHEVPQMTRAVKHHGLQCHPSQTQRQWPRVQAPQPHLPHRWRRACLACQAQAINKPSCPLTLLIYDVQPPTHQHMLGHRLIELWYHILSEQGICNILFAFPDQDAPASCIGCSLLAQLHALVDLPELTLCPPRKSSQRDGGPRRPIKGPLCEGGVACISSLAIPQPSPALVYPCLNWPLSQAPAPGVPPPLSTPLDFGCGPSAQSPL